MKKILFASTALVAAGMMSAGAASAAEAIKLNVGGYSKWWVVGVWQEDGAGTGSAGLTGKKSNLDVKGDNEIWFSGSTALDNGLKVGVMISLEGGGHSDVTTDTIDQSYAWIEGGFGKVLAGIHANGTALLHVQAPDAAGNFTNGGMMLGNYSINKPSGVMGMNQRVGYTSSSNTTAIISDDKAEKITYVAPSFYGLTLGASYIPNVARSTGGHSRSTQVDNLSAYGAGALYTNTFGPVGVKASAGYVYVNLEGLNENNLRQQAYGAQLSYAGFTLGGSYQKADEDFRNGFNTTAALASTNGTLGNLKNGNHLDFGGSAYDVGLSYASGPYAVSFAYFHSSVIGIADSTLRNGKDDTIDAYQVSGKYNLGPGVDILASVGHIEYKDQRDGLTTGLANDAYSNSGWAAMTGLSLKF